MSDKKAKVAQSAVLPYRWRDGKLRILLVTSLDTGRWVLPKGHIDPDHSPRQSAEKEAFEEAGVRGDVAKKNVGSYTYRKLTNKGGHECVVEVFPMDVKKELDDWPEKNKRKRAWMSASKAMAAVAETDLRKLIRRFANDNANVAA